MDQKWSSFTRYGKAFFSHKQHLRVSIEHLLHDKHKMVGFTINYRLEQVRFQLQQESKTAGKFPRGDARTKRVKQAS